MSRSQLLMLLFFGLFMFSWQSHSFKCRAAEDATFSDYLDIEIPYNKFAWKNIKCHFLSDSDTIIVSLDNKTLFQVSVSAPHTVKELKPKGIFLGQRNSDGALMVLNSDAQIQTWSQDLQQSTIAIKPTDYFRQTVLSPDCKLIASPIEPTTLLLQRTSGDHSVRELIGAGTGVSNFVFSSGGKLLASGWLDGTVRMFTTNGAKLFEFKEDSFPIKWIRFTSDDQSFYSRKDAVARFWEVATVSPSRTLDLGVKLNAVACAPNSKVLAAVGAGVIKFLDLRTEIVFCTRDDCDWPGFNNSSFSNDSRYFAAPRSDGRISVFNVYRMYRRIDMAHKEIGLEVLEKSWDDLAQLNAMSADSAIRNLATDTATVFLRQKLRLPVKKEGPATERMQSIIRGLESDDFDVRSSSLVALREFVRGNECLAGGMSAIALTAESKAKVLAVITEMLDNPCTTDTRTLRMMRAIRSLEMNGSAAALASLKELGLTSTWEREKGLLERAIGRLEHCFTRTNEE